LALLNAREGWSQRIGQAGLLVRPLFLILIWLPTKERKDFNLQRKGFNGLFGLLVGLKNLFHWLKLGFLGFKLGGPPRLLGIYCFPKKNFKKGRHSFKHQGVVKVP